MDDAYFFIPFPKVEYKPVKLDPESLIPPKGITTRYGRKLLEQGEQYYKTITIKNDMNKIFGLFSAGGSGEQPHLNVEAEYFDWKMKGVLEGMAWLDPKEYIPFLENAEVGDMIVLKDMIALVRLRFPKDDGDSPVWNTKEVSTRPI